MHTKVATRHPNSEQRVRAPTATQVKLAIAIRNLKMLVSDCICMQTTDKHDVVRTLKWGWKFVLYRCICLDGSFVAGSEYLIPKAILRASSKYGIANVYA